MRFAGTLHRYFALRFLSASIITFMGVFVLVAMVDYVELVRRTSDVPGVSSLLVAKASLFRVPQITEKIIPFSILVGAMACFLNLSRRLELVVARAAGMSAWQFVAPAMAVAFGLGVLATTVYNPISASLEEQSKRLESELMGEDQRANQGKSFWVRQVNADSQSIINAANSREQGSQLDGITVFTFDSAGQFKQRIEAKSAHLDDGHWTLADVRIFSTSGPATTTATYLLPTTLTRAQVRESFATPESVPFWSLPLYIKLAESAGLVASSYRVQYHRLLALPFLLVSMVLVSAAVSLRFFRFGGVQKMVLGGVAAGFLLYVLSKTFEDFSRAGLLNPMVAAWIPVLLGACIGIMTLLYQEDG